MENPYAKETHFSKRKFRVFLKLFCQDFTGLQMASLVHVNRNTANLWMGRFRQRIYDLSEQEKLKNATSVQIDETFFNDTKIMFPKFKWPYREIAVLGIIDAHGSVYARIVEKVNKACVFPVIQECCASGATIFTDGGTVYKGLSKLGYKHAFVNHIHNEFSRYENGLCITTNRIEGFWGWMRVRLTKFRGVKWDHLHLHIAESVWRFNHRKDDLYKILLLEFRKNPIHF